MGGLWEQGCQPRRAHGGPHTEELSPPPLRLTFKGQAPLGPPRPHPQGNAASEACPGGSICQVPSPRLGSGLRDVPRRGSLGREGPLPLPACLWSLSDLQPVSSTRGDLGFVAHSGTGPGGLLVLRISGECGNEPGRRERQPSAGERPGQPPWPLLACHPGPGCGGVGPYSLDHSSQPLSAARMAASRRGSTCQEPGQTPLCTINIYLRFFQLSV